VAVVGRRETGYDIFVAAAAAKALALQLKFAREIFASFHSFLSPLFRLKHFLSAINTQLRIFSSLWQT